MLFTSCDQLEDIFGNDDNSHKNWKFAYAENYIDSLNAIFSNEGYVALFGGTEISLNSNTEELERTIYVAKADFETGIVDEDNATLIFVDSTYMPIQISSKKCIIRFSSFENGNFSCLVNYGEEDEWTEYDGFNIGTLKSTSELHTRSLATGGVSDFTIANALKALDIINGIKGCFQATSMKECVSEGVGVFSNFSPNDEVGITGGLISAGLTKSLSSGLLSILSYAGDKISDGPLKYLGPVKLSIENVEQLDAQSCKIGYMVDGLHEYGMANADLYFELRNVKTSKYYPRLYLETKNGYENAIIANLEPGEYGIILHIRTKKYNWEYTTYPEVKFSIFNLELDRYEIDDNPQYENGVVDFKMNVFIKGNEDGLKDIQQFGYYIKYANAIDYKEVQNLSSIFESTPLTYKLSIPRDGFSNETINYTTFEAKPSIDYYIGVYVVLKNGNIIHFDEETIDGLVYNTKPSIGYNNVSVVGTSQIDSYTDEDGSIAYKYITSYTAEVYIAGSFWIQDVSSTCSGSYTYEGTDSQVSSWEWKPSSDGFFDIESGIMFWDNNLEPCTVSLQLTLDNGRTINADNSLYIAVNPTNTSISITGGRSIQQSLNTNTTHKPKKNDSNNPIKVIPCNKIKLN